MKKTFSRAFSLLLVLALLVSVIPSALAADGDPTISLSANPTSIQVDGQSTITATVTNPVDGATIDWSTTSSDGGSVSLVSKADNSYTVKGVTAGTVTVTATYKKDAEEFASNTTTITVTAKEETTTGTLSFSKDKETLAYGDKTTVQAVYTPVGDEEAPTITYSGTNDYVKVGADGSIEVLKAGGSTKVVAEAGELRAEMTIETVKKEATATISGVPTSMTLGQTANLNIGFTGLPETVKSKVTVSDWKSSNETAVSVVGASDGTAAITANATGEAKISAKLTLNDENYMLAGADASTGVVKVESSTITVSNAALTLTPSTGSLKSGSTNTLTITPSIADGDLPSGASQSNITYSYDPAMVTTGSNVSVSVTPNSDGTFKVSTPKGEGTVKITIKASYNNEVIASNTVTVGVYEEHTIYLTLKDNASRTFDFDDKVFSYYKDGTVKDATNITLQGALTGNKAYGTIKLTLGREGILTLSGTSASTNLLASLKATVNTGKTGTQSISYTWTGDSGVQVAEGILYITVGETTGDIVYNTSYTEKVIFDDSDFTKFWNAKVSQGAVSGTLDYITFEDMKTGVNPKYGQLYYDTACKNPVNTSMEFTTTSRTGYYLLDNVTYKPDSTITSPVTVQIPFTAYSTGTSTTRKSVDGVVVININQDTTTITSYGVQFGNGTNSIADAIADAYKANTTATLGYVTFPTITTSTGKLFYKFSGVLESPLVSNTYKFYAKPTGTQFDLDDVVFVPRAGLYGEVTLYYYAYDASGNNEYKGTIALNVKEKTKSAEFSDVGTSYSWAADSVDFLSYEGIAQGSNGKYRPTANITRGDFMLMLYRAFLEDEHKNDSITSNFSDVVKGSDTYSKETYQAVGVAKKLGIAQGTNGKFNPKSYITRQEAMTLIYRTLDEVNYDLDYTVSTTTSSFKDYSSVASYAKTAISDLIGHGIVIGNNSKINPTSNITRAEMAVILHRVLTY